MMRIQEALGRAIGGLLAPLAAQGSLVRRARLFHPAGVIYRAEVRPLMHEGVLAGLGERLAGPALVRLSGGWWKQHGGLELPEVLGVALRLRRSELPSATVEPSDQDLLFASFRSLWLLPLAALTTKVHDFMANTYYAALPFAVEGLGRASFRLVPSRVQVLGRNRRERLERAVAAGLATLTLEMRPDKGAAPWLGLATIELRERVNVDDEALAFSPFRSGRGIRPVGLLQAMRAAVYPASQLGRRLAQGIMPSGVRAEIERRVREVVRPGAPAEREAPPAHRSNGWDGWGRPPV